MKYCPGSAFAKFDGSGSAYDQTGSTSLITIRAPLSPEKKAFFYHFIVRINKILILQSKPKKYSAMWCSVF